MQSRFKQSKLFFWTVELVLTIIGVYFILQMPNIFSPILKMLSAIFLPLLVAGFMALCQMMLVKRNLRIIWTEQKEENLFLFCLFG